MGEDGKLWTPGAVDFFRTVNEQVAVVEEHAVGGLLLGTARVAIVAMREFQVRGPWAMRMGSSPARARAGAAAPSVIEMDTEKYRDSGRKPQTSISWICV